MSAGDDISAQSSEDSPFSLRPSPRSSGRIRSPNSRYSTDLGWDNVPRRAGRGASVRRGTGVVADPISLDLSGSVNADVDEQSSGSGVRDNDARGEEGKSVEEGGRPVSSKAAGDKSNKKRLCSAGGEWQACAMAVQEITPWGVSNNAERSEAWCRVADKLMEKQTLQVVKNGKTTWVRVDYREGRDPENCGRKDMGAKLTRAWKDRATGIAREEKRAAKKTREGTMTADEPNTDAEQDSERFQLLVSMRLQEATRDQRSNEIAIPIEERKAASDTRDKAAGIVRGGAGGTGPVAGRRGGASSCSQGGRGGSSGRGGGSSSGGGGAAVGGRGSGAGGRGSTAGGRGSAASGRGASAGGRGSAARGRGSTARGRGAAAAGRGAAGGRGRAPRRQARGLSRHQRNGGVLDEWETRQYLGPPPQGGQAPRGGGGGDGAGNDDSVESEAVDADDSPDAEAQSHDDEEAQALSAGMLGRQTRGAKGGGGTMRRQVYRGNAGASTSDVMESLGSAIEMTRERHLNPKPNSVAAHGGSVVDPRVTALQVGLQQNNEALAATTKLAQEGLNVAKQTFGVLERLTATIASHPGAATPAPPAPPAYPYWHGLGGVAPPPGHYQASQGGVHGGIGQAASLLSAPVPAVHGAPPLPSFAGAGGPGTVVTGTGAAGGGAAGARGTGATRVGPAGAGVAGAATAGAAVAGAAVAGAAVAGAVPEVATPQGTGATAPTLQGSTAAASAAQEAMEGRGKKRAA